MDDEIMQLPWSESNINLSVIVKSLTHRLFEISTLDYTRKMKDRVVYSVISDIVHSDIERIIRKEIKAIYDKRDYDNSGKERQDLYRKKHPEILKNYLSSDKGKKERSKSVSKYQKSPAWKEHRRKYYQSSNTMKNSIKKYMNSIKGKETRKRWLKTEKGKQCMKKVLAKRQRGFKWIPLINNPFPEDVLVEYHHVLNNFHAIDAEGSWNKWFVIPMPMITHRFIGGNSNDLGHWRHNEEWIRKLYNININELFGFVGV